MMFCDTDKSLTICICRAVVVIQNEGNSEIPRKLRHLEMNKRKSVPASHCAEVL